MNLSEGTEKTLIAADIQMFVNVLWNPRLELVRDKVILSLMPFLSAFLLDSYRYMLEKEPRLGEALQVHEATLMKSRLRIKPLENRGQRFEEALEENRKIMEMNKEYFNADHSGFLGPLKRLVQPDLGVSFLDNEIIFTTHLLPADAGFTEELLNEKSLTLDSLGPQLYEVSRAYGSYAMELLVALMESLPNEGDDTSASELLRLLLAEVYFNRLDSPTEDLPPVDTSLSVPYRDIHSERFYRRLVKSEDKRAIASALSILGALCQINRARLLVPLLAGDDDLSGLGVAAFKIRFLSLYHAVTTLRHVSRESRQSGLLNPGVQQVIDESARSKEVRRLLKMKALRDNLIHYGVKEPAASRLSSEEPLSGLIEAHTGGQSLERIRDEVTLGLDHVANTLSTLLPSDLASRTRTD